MHFRFTTTPDLFSRCVLTPLVCLVSFMTIGKIAMAQTSSTQSAATEPKVVTGNPPQTPEATRASQPTASPVEAAAQAETEEEAPPTNALYFGGDLYLGRTNRDGVRHLRDGFWAAGSGLGYPSNLYLRLTTRNGAEAKLAFGVGHLYTDEEATFDQPHEAWYRTPLGKNNLTIGKYYVPFAFQEWQYETKWGVMLEREQGANTLAASVNYNENLHEPNAYARLGHNFNDKVNVGISAAGGDGLSYDSLFNKALGLDATVSTRGFNLYSELLAMRRASDQRFNFGWIKLEYDKLGRLKPFIAHWRWRDNTDTFGTFRSNGLGASFEITPTLFLEGGIADTSDQDNLVKWIELHWTPDWRLWNDEPRAPQGVPAALAPKPH